MADTGLRPLSRKPSMGARLLLLVGCPLLLEHVPYLMNDLTLCKATAQAAGSHLVLLTHGGWHAAAEMAFSSDESSGRRYDASSVSSEFEEADLLQPQRSDLFGFLAMDCVLLPIIPEVCPPPSTDATQAGICLSRWVALCAAAQWLSCNCKGCIAFSGDCITPT